MYVVSCLRRRATCSLPPSFSALHSPSVGEGVPGNAEVVGQVPDEILTLAPCAKSEEGKRLDYALQISILLGDRTGYRDYETFQEVTFI